MKVTLILLVCALFASTNAFSKVLHVYSTDVVIKNESGRYINLATSMFGWDCQISAKSKVREIEYDASGDAIKRTYDSKWTYSPNTLWFGHPSIHDDIHVNFGHDNPTLEIDVTEHCQKSEWVTTTEYNYQTEKYETVRKYETEDIYMHWDCRIEENQFPRTKGRKVSLNCPANRSAWGTIMSSWSGEALLVSALQEKEIQVKLQLKRIEDKAKDYNCNGSRKNRHVINFSQGVNGAGYEDDFVFFISINGGKEYRKEEDSGILNMSLAYCAKDNENKIKVSVRAIEEDWDWGGFLGVDGDDTYTPDNDVIFYLNGKSNDREGIIKTRDEDGNYESEIKVKLM